MLPSRPESRAPGRVLKRKKFGIPFVKALDAVIHNALIGSTLYVIFF
jgi:hypothetical protein